MNEGPSRGPAAAGPAARRFTASSFDKSGGRPASVARASAFLKALGHEGRLEILCHLLDGERTVSEISAVLGSTQPAVSQQLMRLRAEELVVSSRRGKNILYSVQRPEVRLVISALRDAFCSDPDESAGGLGPQ